MNRKIAFGLLLAATAIGVPLAGQSGPLESQPIQSQDGLTAVSPAAPGDENQVAESEVPTAPTISLEMLGFTDGLAFDGLDGRTDLSFRVPSGQWLGSARLVLPYKASAAVAAPRTVSILWRDRMLGQFPIAGDGTIAVDLPLAAFAGDVATITVAYSGGSTPNRCFDKRVVADQLRFDASGGLVLTPMPGALPAVSTVALLAGNAPTVALPERPTPDQAAAALSIFAARGASKLVTGEGPDDHVLRIVGSNQPALQSLNATALAIGGRDPAGAVRALFSGTAVLPTSATIDRLIASRNHPKDLTLGDLGANLSTVRVGHEYQWTIALPASRIPGGRSIAGLSADVATLPGDSGTRVSGWINDLMLQAASPGTTGIVHLRLEAPRGITNSMNWLTVRVDRNVTEGCDNPVYPMPSQLLPSSKVILGERETGNDFHHFASASADGVTVVLQDPGGLYYAARVASALLSANVPVTVSSGAVPEKGAVILVSERAPAGLDTPMDLSGGRMRIIGEEGETSYDAPQSADDTIVQLLKRDDGPVLWVRPAESGVVPSSMFLSQGNVAIVAPSGTVQAMATERDRLDVPTKFERANWWDRYKGVIFLLGGLLVGSLLAGFALRPSRKRAKPGQEA